MDKKPRFNIGDAVITKVSVRGSSEPSMCNINEKLPVTGIRKRNDTFIYTCGYNGYNIQEEDLMSVEEYKNSL